MQHFAKSQETGYMSELKPSYRRRDIALSAIAGVIVIAALARMMLIEDPQPTVQRSEPQSTAQLVQPQNRSAPPVEVQVSYSGAVEALPATAKIYVFVRPVGERMPLGVQTFDIHELPVAVAFTPVAGAADPKPVEVVARLSMSGEVSLHPEDLEAVSGPLQFGAAEQRVQLKLGANAEAIAPAPIHDAVGSVRIAVRVSLGEAVRLPATTTVFLIVRSSNGSPMPLAVKRFVLSDLPLEVTLSDADAMMPGSSIGGAGSVEVIARASVSGNVKAEPGDYEARSGALRIAELAAPVVLVISQPL
jgi:hypothetical protein